jgi:PEP-CTERM motif
MRTQRRLGVAVLGLAALSLFLGVAGKAQAGLIAAYDDSGATQGAVKAQLNIGRQFQVTGTGITVFDLGVFDFNSDGLSGPHVVTLFSLDHTGSGATATPVSGGSVTVPSGMAGTLTGGFRYTALAAPVFLAPGNYAEIAYGLYSSAGPDPYGDGGAFTAAGSNVSAVAFDPFDFTNASSPAYPTNGDSNNHSSASFLFQNGPLATPVPEPSSLALFALGGLGLTVWRRWRKRRE